MINQRLIKKDFLIDKLDTRVFELEAVNTLKTKQISDLQTQLGALTTCYFDLKIKLDEEFSDKFKSFVEDFSGARTSQQPLPIHLSQISLKIHHL